MMYDLAMKAARCERLEAAIGRVKELHKPVNLFGLTVCNVCEVDDHIVEYPCETIEILRRDTLDV